MTNQTSIKTSIQMKSMAASKGNQSKLMRIVTSPFRALVKAKDLYVRGMTSCGNSAAFNGAAGFSASSDGVYALPKSFSTSSAASSASYDSEDFRELVRAASARTISDRIDKDLTKLAADAPPTGKVPRSCSVGMAKIDEDQACDQFENGDGGALLPMNKKKKSSVAAFPRSQSYAVPKRSAMMF